jgi:hypothetical protein
MAVDTIASCAKARPELRSSGERCHQQQLRSPDCLPCSGSHSAVGLEFLFAITASLVCFNSERRPDNQRLPVPDRGIVGSRYDRHRHPLGLRGSDTCSHGTNGTRSGLLTTARKGGCLSIVDRNSLRPLSVLLKRVRRHGDCLDLPQNHCSATMSHQLDRSWLRTGRSHFLPHVQRHPPKVPETNSAIATVTE